ncbi:hypothetical protein HBA54_04875 [Pelagibius litoralis]|uniref:Uncharacterized protein n=1 Tax=Pelagibius litoralis TaxID=374515 RepID=A0A967CB49_9PROT|nr:hypothetical protein [Pelagibius litoralis]NIA67919.1 hypothetical protein [Pelagibius litoralis]
MKPQNNTLSRRRVLTGAAAVSVAASAPAAATAREEMSPRIAELFTDWRNKHAAFLASSDHHCATFSGTFAEEDASPTNLAVNAALDASFAAYVALVWEPSFTLADVAAKAYATEVDRDGCDISIDWLCADMARFSDARMDWGQP